VSINIAYRLAILTPVDVVAIFSCQFDRLRQVLRDKKRRTVSLRYRLIYDSNVIYGEWSRSC